MPADTFAANHSHYLARPLPFLALSIGLLVLLACGYTSAPAEETQSASSATAQELGLTPRPMPRLPSGIVVGDNMQGFNQLVTFVSPRLASGDIDSLPDYARRYASMFKFTVLANVTSNATATQPDATAPQFRLDKIGIGFAMDIGGKPILVTSETANRYGAELGMIDRKVLSGNESCLDDIMQVARTDRLVIFDAKSNMLIQGRHEERILRHFVWVSPQSGKIGFLIWQLKETGEPSYAIDSPDMRLLPAAYREDRQIHVSDGGILSAIPTPSRFALEKIPSGTSVPFSPTMRAIAGAKRFTPATLKQFLGGTSESIALLRTPRKTVR